MKKAIIIGATSGIGEALIPELIQQGYQVGLTGRREEKLKTLHHQFPGQTQYEMMDVSVPDQAIASLQQLIEKMGGMDLIVINAGVGNSNPDHEWDKDRSMIEVNVLGFVAIADTAMQKFIQQGSGHLVGISSIAAIRNHGSASVYGATKAFVSHYLEGLRHNVFKRKLPIVVTDIQPGFVDTPMTEGQPGMFWVATAEQAARQISQTIREKRGHAYITRRWRWIAWLMKSLPDFLYLRLS